MTKQEQARIERLDRWLAMQEVMGRTFPGTTCAILAFDQETGNNFYCPDEPFERADSKQWKLYKANDENNGSPGAVRAKLHELYPFLLETPSPKEVVV